MMKQYKINSKKKGPLEGGQESFLAPAPSPKGRIYAIDQHPDTNTVAVVKGMTPHDMVVEQTKGDMDLVALVEWLSQCATHKDQILVEAGNGCFDLCSRLAEKNLSCCVLESTWIGNQASQYVDSDKLAAVRIARVYLQGNAKAVWTPDQKTIERRELLHLYNVSIKNRVRATNVLKSYLTSHGVRPGLSNLCLARNQEKLWKNYEWSAHQTLILRQYLSTLNEAHKRSKEIELMMIKDLRETPDMLKLMGLVGIGKINAFALLAVIGDITRFKNPKKLASYFGLNPSQKTSGNRKNVKIGVGKRGRRDVRTLLVQASQTVLRMKDNPLAKWGMKLLLRKGHRNIAITAVARKIVTQVWHLLMGNKPDLLESTTHRKDKFKRMLGELGKESRLKMGLPKTLDLCVEHLDQLIEKEIKNLSQKTLA